MIEFAHLESGGQADADWTSLQQRRYAVLLTRFQANLHFLSVHYPAVFEQVMAQDISATLRIDEHGCLCLHAGDAGGYQYRQQLAAEQERYRDCLQGSGRVTLDDVWTHAEAGEADWLRHAGHPDFVSQSDVTARRALFAQFRQLTDGLHQERSFNPHGGQALVAVVLGGGLGWMIERIVDDWDIRHLLLVEQDMQRFVNVLHLVDLVTLQQRFARRGIYLSIILRGGAEAAAAAIRAHFHQANPPYFLHQARIFPGSAPDQSWLATWQTLEQRLWLELQGWGFWDDELLGAAQALHNLAQGIPLLQSRPSLPDGATAVVVGNGPSLDGLRAYLQAARGRVVIISCGSAVTALARWGIRPDLHVESERTGITARVLEEGLPAGFLRDIPVLAPSNMVPDLFRLTAHPYLIAKAHDLAAWLSLHDLAMPRCETSPTCVNAAVDMALRCGFSRLVLAGVDFGFHDVSRHHARDSLYYTDPTQAGEHTRQVIALTDTQLQDGLMIPANRGGLVASIPGFVHARDALQLTLAEFPQATVWNISEGAAIAGTLPVRPDEVPWPEVSGAQVLPALWQAFSPVDLALVQAHWQALGEQLQAVTTTLQGGFTPPPRTLLEAQWRLADVHDQLEQVIRPAMPAMAEAVRGSLLHLGNLFHQGAQRLPVDRHPAWIAAFMAVLAQFFADIQGDWSSLADRLPLRSVHVQP